MKMSEFNYKLPKELIAQYPPQKRGTSNLLVLDRKSGNMEDRKYFNISEYVRKGDVIVLNETQVLNCRTYFLTPSAKRVEVLFLKEIPNKKWFVLIGRAKNVQNGDLLNNEEDNHFQIEVKERSDNGFIIELKEGEVLELFKKYGHTPLPPYMIREDEESDKERYNTVFSKKLGAVAAPTASLNLTKDILEDIQRKGAKIVKIELRVGWGTFAPVREENIEDHKIHEENISVSKEAASTINAAILKGGRIWAFGTTVARTLESIAHQNESDERSLVKPFNGETDLYIYPGYQWKIVDILVTNFHMPETSLLLLANSFAGRKLAKEAYEHAIIRKYKFLSYGDSMLIGDNLIEKEK